jgi:flavin-dependent dehydrogenase
MQRFMVQAVYFSGKKYPVENGIYMAGDAAGIIAPLAGDGIRNGSRKCRDLSGKYLSGNKKH